PPFRGQPRISRDRGRGRAPPGTAHQGTARSLRRARRRRQANAPRRTEEPAPARAHVLALPSRKPGDLAAYRGAKPHAPAALGAGESLWGAPLLRPLGQPYPGGWSAGWLVMSRPADPPVQGVWAGDRPASGRGAGLPHLPGEARMAARELDQRRAEMPGERGRSAVG